MRLAVRGAERLVQGGFSPDGYIYSQGMIPPVHGPGLEGPQVHAETRTGHDHKSL